MRPYESRRSTRAGFGWGSLVLLALVLLGIPARGLAQAAGDGEKQAAAEGLSAEAILAKAAAAQGGKEIAADFRNFSADFETSFFDEERGQIYYQVKRIFQFPCMLWTEKRHDLKDPPTYEVYNGEDGWFVDAKGEVTVYTDQPATFKTDLDKLDEDVRVTKEIFRNFFIAGLAGELQDLTRLQDKAVFGDKDLLVVSGRRTTRIAGEEGKTSYVRIFVDPDTFLVRGVEMIDLDDPGQRRLFLFEEYLANKQGVRVPTRTFLFENPDPSAYAGIKKVKPKMTIYLNCERGEDGKIRPLIEFNLKLDPKLFQVPEEK